MIDNHPAAYPQWGLARASLTFEAVTEFGLTRFMAVYLRDGANRNLQIGPVRSARTYFVRWAAGFGAVYVHSGGSPQSLDLLRRTESIEDIDSLTRDGTAFVRDRTRQSPHNLHTTLAALAKVSDAADAFPEAGFLFAPDAGADFAPAGGRIDYYFLYREDAVTWIYDPTTDAYLRLRNNAPARDTDGSAVTTRNLVVIEVPEEPIVGDSAGRVELQVMGEGTGQLFVAGGGQRITWRKASSDAPLRFFGPSGEEIRFRPGSIWIAAIPNIDQVVAR
jgi:hypothetical protein